MILNMLKNKRLGISRYLTISVFQVFILLFLCVVNIQVHAIQMHEGVELSEDVAIDSESFSSVLLVPNDEVPILNNLANINNVKNELSRKLYYSHDSTADNELSIADILSFSEIDIKDEIAFDDASKGWNNLKGMVKDVKGGLISGLPEIDRVVVTDFFDGSSSKDVTASYDTYSYNRHFQSNNQDNSKGYTEYSSNDNVPTLYLIYHKVISFFQEHFVISFLIIFIVLSLLFFKAVVTVIM